MAELKQNEIYELVLPKQAETVVTSEPVLPLPTKKTRFINIAERLVIATVLAGFIALAVFTIKMATQVSELETEIMVVQRDVNQKTEEASKLEQEKGELSRAERIKKAADAEGLSIIDDNIRNVRK